MITTTRIRLAMMVLWLGMLVTSRDILWLCLICITAVDVLDSIEDQGTLTKIVNIHTGEERTIQTFDCSICDDKFSENDTGLQRGIIGSTIVSLCPICLKGIINLVDYISNQTSIEE